MECRRWEATRLKTLPFAATTPCQWGGTQLGTAVAQAFGYTQWGCKHSGDMHGVPNSSVHGAPPPLPRSWLPHASVQPTPTPVRRSISISQTRSQILADLQLWRNVLLDVRRVELRDPGNGGTPVIVIYCGYTTLTGRLGILRLEIRACWAVLPADAVQPPR